MSGWLEHFRRVWLLLCLLTTVQPAAGLANEPTMAQVKGTQAFALSGPGIGYYPTSEVPRGQQVKIVRKSDAWLAIEPPAGSFSWILGDFLRENADGTAIVTMDSATVYVGSALIDARHVTQVKLNKGDRVQLLGRDQATKAGKPVVWYKIVPPAGEVRYLAASQLKERQEVVRESEYRSLTNDHQPATSNDRRAATTSTPTAVMPATPSVALPSATAVSVQAIPPAQPIGMEQASTTATKAEKKDVPLVVVKLSDDPKQPFEKRLATFQEQLRSMRKQLPETWDTESARTIAEDLGKKAKGKPQQDQAASLVEQIDWFANLQERYREASQRRQLALQRDADLAAMQAQLQERFRVSTGAATAVGLLHPSEQRIDGRPSFTLEGTDGRITHYVLLAEGINPDRHLGKRVGLLGTVSSREGLSHPLILVDQIGPQ